MALEMQIYNPEESAYITEIKWNYEDIKAEVAAQAETYATAVYTDDLIKQAKSDRAKLNKFVKALKDRRTDVRKKLLAPDEQFGKQVDEIVGIVQKAITNIDMQVKNYETKQRNDKIDKLRAEFDSMIGDLKDTVMFERIYVPEWSNASFALSKAKGIMQETIDSIKNGINLIQNSDSPYAGDMMKVFLDTYDIGRAMERRIQLEEEAKRRAAYEEERRKQQEERDRKAAEEARRQALLQHIPEEVRPAVKQGIEAVVDKPEPEPKQWIAFEALLDTHHAMLLAGFFRSQGIEFRPINKGE